jgi:glycosyltransferase involved in cell wall biosynthesis
LVGRKAILLVSNDMSHPALATQQFVFSWRINRLRPLQRKGYEVVLVSAGGLASGRGLLGNLIRASPGLRQTDGIAVISPPVPRLPMIWFVFSVLFSPIMTVAYCKSRRLDVEAIVAGSVVYGFIARLINAALHAFLVVDYGDPDYVRERHISLRFLRLLERLVLARPGVDLVTCIDPVIGGHLEQLGVRSYSFFPPGGFWKHEARADLRPARGGEMVVLYAGHVAPPPTYRLDLLVEAAPRVLKRHPATRFIIVGDGSFVGRMKNRARQLGIADRFEFTGGVSHNEALALAGRADVCVQLLSDMCLGTKVIDYFALGKATLSCGSFYDKYREFLANGRNCLLVPPTAEGVAEGLTRLLLDDKLRRDLGAAALETSRGLDWEAQSEKLLALIAERRNR